MILRCMFGHDWEKHEHLSKMVFGTWEDIYDRICLRCGKEDNRATDFRTARYRREQKALDHFKKRNEK